VNTLRDAYKGKVRPSVWPVYVMSVVFGGHGLVIMELAVFKVWQLQQPVEVYWTGPQIPGMSGKTVAIGLACLYGLFGLFCIVAAVSASKLRPWAWWSIAVVVAVYLGRIPAALTHDYSARSLRELVIRGCLCFVLLWALVTRWHLFFPPKPEGEE